MFKNYVKITLRNVLKYKSYSLINILGLAIGITCCVLILLFVTDELSYDTYHDNADRTYRVTREWFNNDGSTSLHLARVAPPIGPLLKSDFPDVIEEVCRITSDYQTYLQYEDKTFIEDDFFWAENSIFDVMTIPFVAGDPQTALKEPNTVVLTEEMAAKFFDGEDALGKYIVYEKEREMKVTGVIRNIPENTHFKFDYLASFETLYETYGEEELTANWGSNNYATYLRLAENSTPENLLSQVPAFIDRHLTARILDVTGAPPNRTPSLTTTLHLQKLPDIHLHSHLSSEFEPNGDINNVYLFSVIAFFILLIACINFMNLATARSARRANEIGMRKVLGAYRWQLIKQFLGESIFISAMAMLIAIALIELSLPFFNDFSGKNLSLDVIDNPLMAIGLVSLTLFVGIISGSYPAFFLSAFRPIAALKSKSNTGTSGHAAALRKILVIGQFAISIALIISMGIVHQQMEFFRSKKLGFNKDHVLILPTSRYILDNTESVRAQLTQHPNIVSMTTSKRVPSGRLSDNWGGRTLDGDQPQPLSFRLAVVGVDYGFLDTYQLELVAGRDFSRDFATDDTAAFILNEAAIAKLGWGTDEAVGKPLRYGSRTGTVVGVVKDFHFESLHNEIVPLILLITDNRNWNVTVRIRPEDMAGTLAFLQDKWQGYREGYPFEYDFLDERLSNLYSAEEKLGEIFSYFSFLAVMIACLGLFGLAAFAAEQRTKEIGVRKVMGASVSNIIGLMSKEFVKLILISGAVACPLAYFLMNNWLDEFAYRIEIGFGVFLLAGLLALIIALLTVSYQAIKAALSNPIDALRYE